MNRTGFIKQLDPLCFPLIAVLLCFVRWGFVANGYDFGWDFETGYRVSHGGVYGKDFYTALGPLAYELIGFIFKIFGAHWVFIYLIYYTCWMFSLLGVYFLLRNFSEKKTDLAFVMIIVAPLSIPHLLALHAYNFLSYSLAIWCGVFVFDYLNKGKFWRIIIASGFAALSLFAKQNLGLGSVLLAIALIMMNYFTVNKKCFAKTVGAVLAFCFGFMLVSGSLFYIFSREIGATELYHLMFTDAASAKGSFFNMIKTAFPRISFGTSIENKTRWFLQHFAELLCYAVIVGINFFLYRKFLRANKTGENNTRNENNNLDLIRILGLLCLTLVIPLLNPKIAFKWREWFYWIDTNYRLVTPMLVFLYLFVLVNLFFCFYCSFKKSHYFWGEQKMKILLSLYAIGLTFVVCASRFQYIFLNAPLIVGIFLVSILNIGLFSKRQLYILCASLLMGGYLFYPTHALGPMTRMEGAGLRGLFFSKAELGAVEIYTTKLKPYVINKRTLWLSMGGPHSLTGAIPVRNVSNLYFDQFNSRIEESLVRDWMAHPPEMIVRFWYALPENSVWLKSEEFENWIRKNYVQVDEIEGRKVLKYLF